MKPSSWIPDILPSFELATLLGLSAPDVLADVVLIRRRCTQATTRAVLYIHGFVDYFFQTHLADFYNNAGLHFYAIDLRRHGRSMRPHQLRNYTSDIDEYLQDVNAAITVLKNEEGIDWLLLNGHSTGGLVDALYAHRGHQHLAVNALFLNSPFLDMNLPYWLQLSLEPVIATLGAVFPHLQLPRLSSVYGQSLHANHHGEWHYNTQWKPIDGFPVFAGWFRAIHLAHAEVAQGLSIDCPILVMHAGRSAWPKRWCDDAMTADIVLNVSDIQRLSPRLGAHVEVRAIEDGVHDLILSKPKPRQKTFNELLDWLVRIGGIHHEKVK